MLKRIYIIALLLSVLPILARAQQLYGSQTAQGVTIDFTLASVTKPMATVGSDPSGSCSNAAALVLSTASGNLFSCVGGTWHTSAGGSIGWYLNNVSQGAFSSSSFDSGSGVSVNSTNSGGIVHFGFAYNSALIPTHPTIHANENYIASSNGTTAYTASMPNLALTAYNIGMMPTFEPDVTCSSTCSLAIDGLPPISITQANGSAPSGSLVSHQPQTLTLGPDTCTLGTNCTFLLPPGGASASNYQTVANVGSSLTQRPTLNFSSGGCTDNPGANRTDCSFSSGGGSAITGPTLLAAPPGYTGVAELYNGPLNEYTSTGAIAPIPYGPASATNNGAVCWTSAGGSSIGTCAYFLVSTIYSAAGTPLPTCNSGLTGARAVVSDATSPSYLGAYTSGGSVKAPVFCTGSAWVTD